MAWSITSGTSAMTGKTAVTLSEVVMNQSTKELVFNTDVSAMDAYVELLSIRLELGTSQTEGTRLMELHHIAESGVMLHKCILHAEPVEKGSYQLWQLARGAHSQFGGWPQCQSLPECWIFHGSEMLRVTDIANIDPTGDSLHVHVQGISQK